MMPFGRLCVFMKNGIVQGRAKVLVESSWSRLALLHSGCRLEAYEKSKNVGNPYRNPHLDGKFSIPRWKLTWLYMMKRKAEIEGVEEERPRSDKLNWNYESELEAFAHRLKIQVHSNMIRAAFTEPTNDATSQELSESSAINIDNEGLFSVGYEITVAFIQLYIKTAFPMVGRECADSIVDYLTSESLLSYIAQHLGYRDLIQSPVFPINPIDLYRCFLASIGAVMCGPGGKVEAAKFVYDFIIVNLIDKDIVHDIWKPKDPMKVLVEELKSRNLPPPEVRLTKQSGINTVTPVFFVGLFCDQELLSESGGESIIKAEADAAKLALKYIYQVSVDRFHPLVDCFSDIEFIQNVESLQVDAPSLPFVAGKSDRELEDRRSDQTA